MPKIVKLGIFFALIATKSPTYQSLLYKMPNFSKTKGKITQQKAGLYSPKNSKSWALFIATSEKLGIFLIKYQKAGHYIKQKLISWVFFYLRIEKLGILYANFDKLGILYCIY